MSIKYPSFGVRSEVAATAVTPSGRVSSSQIVPPSAVFLNLFAVPIHPVLVSAKATIQPELPALSLVGVHVLPPSVLKAEFLMLHCQIVLTSTMSKV